MSSSEVKVGSLSHHDAPDEIKDNTNVKVSSGKFEFLPEVHLDEPLGQRITLNDESITSDDEFINNFQKDIITEVKSFFDVFDPRDLAKFFSEKLKEAYKADKLNTDIINLIIQKIPSWDMTAKIGIDFPKEGVFMIAKSLERLRDRQNLGTLKTILSHFKNSPEKQLNFIYNTIVPPYQLSDQGSCFATAQLMVLHNNRPKEWMYFVAGIIDRNKANFEIFKSQKLLFEILANKIDFFDFENKSLWGANEFVIDLSNFGYKMYTEYERHPRGLDQNEYEQINQLRQTNQKAVSAIASFASNGAKPRVWGGIISVLNDSEVDSTPKGDLTALDKIKRGINYIPTFFRYANLATELSKTVGWVYDTWMPLPGVSGQIQNSEEFLQIFTDHIEKIIHPNLEHSAFPEKETEKIHTIAKNINTKLKQEGGIVKTIISKLSGTKFPKFVTIGNAFYLNKPFTVSILEMKRILNALNDKNLEPSSLISATFRYVDGEGHAATFIPGNYNVDAMQDGDFVLIGYTNYLLSQEKCIYMQKVNNKCVRLLTFKQLKDPNAGMNDDNNPDKGCIFLGITVYPDFMTNKAQ